MLDPGGSSDLVAYAAKTVALLHRIKRGDILAATADMRGNQVVVPSFSGHKALRVNVPFEILTALVRLYL